LCSSVDSIRRACCRFCSVSAMLTVSSSFFIRFLSALFNLYWQHVSPLTMTVITNFKVKMTIRYVVATCFCCWYLTWPCDLDLWLSDLDRGSRSGLKILFLLVLEYATSCPPLATTDNAFAAAAHAIYYVISVYRYGRIFQHIWNPWPGFCTLSACHAYMYMHDSVKSAFRE